MSTHEPRNSARHAGGGQQRSTLTGAPAKSAARNRWSGLLFRVRDIRGGGSAAEERNTKHTISSICAKKWACNSIGSGHNLLCYETAWAPGSVPDGERLTCPRGCERVLGLSSLRRSILCRREQTTGRGGKDVDVWCFDGYGAFASRCLYFVPGSLSLVAGYLS
jgi:hypothetical protein